MTRDQARHALFAAIQSVAPEADPTSIPPDCDFRAELDIDSMDFLNIINHLHKSLGVSIAERDYSKLFSVESAVEFLAPT